MLAHNGERPATDDAVNGARKSGNATAETSKPHTHQAQASLRVDRYTLHHGNTPEPLATIIPDVVHPGMYRVWANGQLSDLANLTRGGDRHTGAATASNWQMATFGEAQKWPPVDFEDRGAAP
jgi:hypothetical protein